MFKYLMSLLAMALVLCGCGEQEDGQIRPLNGSAAEEFDAIETVDVNKLLTIDEKGARVGIWTTDVAAALELAKERKLGVLELFIGSDWSYASGCFVKNVLATDEWRKFVDGKFVLVYLDFPRRDHRMTEEIRRRNEQLRTELGISDYPSMLFCGDDGKPMANLRANAVVTTAEMIHRIRMQVRELPWEQENLVLRTGDATLLATYKKVNELYAERAKFLADCREKINALDSAIRENSSALSEGVLKWEVGQKSAEDQKLYWNNLEKFRRADAELKKIRSENLQMTVKTSETIETLQREMVEAQRILEEILLR